PHLLPGRLRRCRSRGVRAVVPGQRPAGVDQPQRDPRPRLRRTQSPPMLDQSLNRLPAAGGANHPTESVPVRRIRGGDLNTLLERERLVTNGLGGYASGTVAGGSTRRYHGRLIAAHPAPLGRVVMWNHLTD